MVFLRTGWLVQILPECRSVPFYVLQYPRLTVYWYVESVLGTTSWYAQLVHSLLVARISGFWQTTGWFSHKHWNHFLLGKKRTKSTETSSVHFFIYVLPLFVHGWRYFRSRRTWIRYGIFEIERQDVHVRPYVLSRTETRTIHECDPIGTDEKASDSIYSPIPTGRVD